jgi:hypothetical protein
MTFRLNLTNNVIYYLQDTKLNVIIYLNYFNFKSFMLNDFYKLMKSVYFIWRNRIFKKYHLTNKVNLKVSTCSYTITSTMCTRSLLSYNVRINHKTTFNLDNLSLYFYKNPRYLVYNLLKFSYSLQFLNLLYIYNINFKGLYRCLESFKLNTSPIQYSKSYIRPLSSYLLNYI